MSVLKLMVLAPALALGGAAALAARVHARDQAQLHAVWTALDAEREADPPRYDPATVADLPEVAQRYFARAIEPGTPLHRVVRLDMQGTFLLNGNPLPMSARQILAPPGTGFVWEADVGRGLMRFSGSDGYHVREGGGAVDGRGAVDDGGAVDSWTKFWLRGLIPLVRVGGNHDHARAAATRVLLEAVWAPASLLPQFGAEWVQTGPDTAQVRLADTGGAAPRVEPMHITLDAEGNLFEVHALRWSNANPGKIYRLQPFGGRILQVGRFEGFLIPVRVEMGNMYGTPEYVPFFQATVTAARFGRGT